MSVGKGVEHYYTAYTQEQLWRMLMESGDAWSVEQAGQFWNHAGQRLELLSADLDARIAEAAGAWRDAASDRYQAWIAGVLEHAAMVRQGMELLEKHVLPVAAVALDAVCEQARAAGLDPSYWADLNEWVQDHYSALEGLGERQLRQAHTAFRDEQRHRLAELVAGLGDRYQGLIADTDERLPQWNWTTLPGADTYVPLRGEAIGRPVTFPDLVPRSDPESEDTDENDVEFDETPAWTPLSYTDIDRDLAPVPPPRTGWSGLFGRYPAEDTEARYSQDRDDTPAEALGRRLARDKGDTGLATLANDGAPTFDETFD